MPKKTVKKFIPSFERISALKALSLLGNRIYKQKNWYVNKSTISKAMFIGLFVAMIPIPFQMVISAVLALLFGANLPLSIMLVWITNPITMPFFMAFEYWLGSLILNKEVLELEFTIEWFDRYFDMVFISLYTGSLILSLSLGFLSYHLSIFFWRKKVRKNKKDKVYK